MTTIGDVMKFAQWLIDFIQMIIGWFNKTEEEAPAE